MASNRCPRCGQSKVNDRCPNTRCGTPTETGSGEDSSLGDVFEAIGEVVSDALDGLSDDD